MADFFSRFGGAGTTDGQSASAGQNAIAPAVAPTMPAPTKLPEQQASAPSVTAGAEQGAPTAQPQDAFSSRFSGSGVKQSPYEQITAQLSGAPDGSSSERAINQSPLSLLDRAHVAYLRDPNAQVKLLSTIKGIDEATFVPNGNTGYLAVKQDGKWYHADHDFEWNLKDRIGDMDNHGLKGVGGALADFAGEYGLRTLGAVGATMAGAATGGLAPAAVMAAGAAGWTAGEAANIGALRAGGHDVYKDDIPARLATQALVGMANEVGGAVIGKALPLAIGAVKAAPDAIASLFAKAEGNPTTSVALRKLSSMIPGGEMSDMVANAMPKNPGRLSAFINAAKSDLENPMAPSKMDAIQDLHIDTLHDLLRGVQQKAGAEFGALRADPAVKNATIDASGSFGKALGFLEQEGLIKAAPDSLSGFVPNSPAREFGDGGEAIINKILLRSKNANKMSYDGARGLVQDLGTLLDSNPGNRQIVKTLADLKLGVHGDIIDGIPEAAAQKYGDTLTKYATASDMLSTFNKMTDSVTGQKRITFMNKLMSPDLTANQQFMRQMIQGGVPEDLFTAVLQGEGARKMAAIVAKPGSVKALLPNGTKLQGNVLLGAAKLRDALFTQGADARAAQAALPYQDNVMRMLTKMPAEARASLLSNPQALDMVKGVIDQGPLGESVAQEMLLKQLGVK